MTLKEKIFMWLHFVCLVLALVLAFVFWKWGYTYRGGLVDKSVIAGFYLTAVASLFVVTKKLVRFYFILVALLPIALIFINSTLLLAALFHLLTPEYYATTSKNYRVASAISLTANDVYNVFKIHSVFEKEIATFYSPAELEKTFKIVVDEDQKQVTIKNVHGTIEKIAFEKYTP